MHFGVTRKHPPAQALGVSNGGPPSVAGSYAKPRRGVVRQAHVRVGPHANDEAHREFGGIEDIGCKIKRVVLGR